MHPSCPLKKSRASSAPLPNLAPSWNVAPTQSALVVRRHPETAERHLDPLKWGLLPYWTKEPTKARRPINARSETAAKSGMFRGALARRRCIVHADTFYEWKVVEGGNQPYAIARQDGKPLAFAGIWESFRWPDETLHCSFAIMTTRPNAEMDDLHDRMPVILGEQDWPVWLAEVDGDPNMACRSACRLAAEQRTGIVRSGVVVPPDGARTPRL
jgi:putative SOS response-associated peptidase YedK